MLFRVFSLFFLTRRSLWSVNSQFNRIFGFNWLFTRHWFCFYILYSPNRNLSVLIKPPRRTPNPREADRPSIITPRLGRRGVPVRLGVTCCCLLSVLLVSIYLAWCNIDVFMLLFMNLTFDLLNEFSCFVFYSLGVIIKNEP